MSERLKSVDLSGGESVYCINQAQLDNALQLAQKDSAGAGRIQDTLARVERELSRNERAALAFILIERLRSTQA